MSDAVCHCGPGSTEARPGHETLVLVGNPNVGKSVVFNALTGTYVDVSNFPGTTVSLTRGRMGEHDIVDTPGVYGVSSFNDEETVARDIILDGEIVINVVDAVHLERDLFLTLQLVDMGKRMVVALNMADEARKRGVKTERAEEAYGVFSRAMTSAPLRKFIGAAVGKDIAESILICIRTEKAVLNERSQKDLDQVSDEHP